MCGIALVVSGIPFDLSSLFLDSIYPPLNFDHPEFSSDDLKAALRRRGPDSLGSAKIRIFLSKNSSSSEETEVKSVIEREEDVRAAAYCKEEYGMNDNGYCIAPSGRRLLTPVAELYLIGATLQLRGINPITQPLFDAAENILVYNGFNFNVPFAHVKGEIFGGIYVARDSNDAQTLLQSLGKCCSCVSSFHERNCYVNGKRQSTVSEVFSMIKGPWSVIYWQDSTKTLWFGRDAFGRRSLLVHWPTLEDSRFLLSSVSSALSVVQDTGFEAETGSREFSFWEELPCGIYSLSFETQNSICCLIGEIRKHELTNDELKALIKWERINVVPAPEVMCPAENEISSGPCNINSVSSETLLSGAGLRQPSVSRCAETVLAALKESVMRRSSLHAVFQGVSSDSIMGNVGPVAVLFSGGLDSMILAALLDQCLDCCFDIDLLNVSFDGPFAPDRISARDGIKELRRISPLRRWKLVEIDADLENLMIETKHVMSLINPSNTYMDMNIGIALWLASGGDGWIYDGSGYDDYNNRLKYKSRARILLVGSGADEQCAGYGRHRTNYRHRSWVGLHEEMKLDMQRIWKRNLGRDDRCIADNGKEARFPFLDEDVIRTLLDIPLWEIAELDKPSGTGDKKILREVAKMLGLHEAAVLPKRAIQFGSRIARESNRKNFGSNRAANHASAGSVKIHGQAKRTR